MEENKKETVQGTENQEQAPKKKNLAFVIRPQNSKNSSRFQSHAKPAKAAKKTAPKPAAKQGGKKGGNDSAKAGAKDVAAASAKSHVKEAVKGSVKEGAKEVVREEKAMAAKGSTKEITKDIANVNEKSRVKEHAKEITKEAARESVKGSEKESDKETKKTVTAAGTQDAAATVKPAAPVRTIKVIKTAAARAKDEQERAKENARKKEEAAGRRGNGAQGGGRRPGAKGRDGFSARDKDDTKNDRRNRGPIRGRDDKEKIEAPMMEQRSSRNRSKDKEKDKEREFKKKEYENEDFSGKNRRGKKGKQTAEVKKPQPKQEKKEETIKQIVLPEVMTIKELADKMKIAPAVIVKKLFLQGKIVTVNHEIDYDTAEEIAMEYEILCEKEVVVDVIEELLKEDEEDEALMVKRPPVVCVMGHVDHGKTSLLDAIRDTNVIDREAGGITQHIGAYIVEANGEKITFLDTPGHEAFTAMRMRGANATDIAILVVAADDGVMPQTIEAINHAKAAGIEIIVAVNKIDKPSANVERVKQELTEYELIAEDWGGSTIFVPVSARTKEGITDLLDMILLTAEVMELKANPNRSARGLVIEAELNKGKGSVATVLVQKGTLHVGDAIAAGSACGKVRAMMDDKGRRVKVAGPSQPVEILGLNEVPNAGEVFVSCDTEKEARQFAETFISQNKVRLLDETKSKMSLDDLFTQIKENNLKELNIVVKADVQGSVEALKQSLLKLSNEEIVIKIIHGGVGAITESDVNLASASNAIIIGFNVRPDAMAKEIADREGVDLRLYRVIYNAIEDVEAAMKGMLDPIFEEKVIGHAEVRQTFKASGVGTIAGAYVQDGLFERNCKVRLSRDGEVIFDGPLASLKRFKDDVKEVKAGYECGFVFENHNDIQEGDSVEAYKMVEVERA